MIDSVLFVVERMIRKDFWLFFLASFGIALLFISRNQLKQRFFRMAERGY